MTDLDFRDHRKCHVCGVLMPEKRMLNYNDRWYCGIIHKLQQEKCDEEALRRPAGSVRYHRDEPDRPPDS